MRIPRLQLLGALIFTASCASEVSREGEYLSFINEEATEVIVEVEGRAFEASYYPLFGGTFQVRPALNRRGEPVQQFEVWDSGDPTVSVEGTGGQKLTVSDYADALEAAKMACRSNGWTQSMFMGDLVSEGYIDLRAVEQFDDDVWFFVGICDVPEKFPVDLS